MTPFRRFQAGLTPALVLTALGLAALAQGARAEDAPAATNGQPRAEGAVQAATPSKIKQSMPPINSTISEAERSPPKRYVPTIDDPEGQIKAVDFPKDI